MNRYIAGGLLAALVVFLGSGLESLGNILPGLGSTERSPGQSSSTVSAQADSLGTQPIEQAGRAVQRQSQSAMAAPTTTFDQRQTPIQGTSTMPQEFPVIEPLPQSPNVIPRPGAAPQATTTTGDLSPIQPDLVQPGNPELPGIDQDLDSIPALW